MLSENIKASRKKKGLSQEELARELHIVRQTVSKWEKGLSVPDAEMLIRIAQALDTSVGALLGETQQEETEPDSIKELAAKLELLNEQFAKRTERNRKILRTVFLLLGVLALWGATKELLGLFYQYQFQTVLSSSSTFIGGADEPTSIYVSNVPPRLIPALITAAAGVAALIGVYWHPPQVKGEFHEKIMRPFLSAFSLPFPAAAKAISR